jgi:hypothetical protein
MRRVAGAEEACRMPENVEDAVRSADAEYNEKGSKTAADRK